MELASKIIKTIYAEGGGMEKAQIETRSGSEISMYHRDEEGEEEVLWMLVRVPISGGRTDPSLNEGF